MEMNSVENKRVLPEPSLDTAKEAKRLRSFVLQPQMGEKDLFSSLEDDCLLSVLFYLDRDTLDTMEGVSQKMHSLVNHDGYRKQKKIVHSFEIILESDELTLYSNPVRSNQRQLVYEKGGAKSAYHYFKGHGPRRMTLVERPTTVPKEFFDAMKELFRKYSPKKIKFTEIIIDTKFFENLVSAFDGDIPKALALEGVVIRNIRQLIEFILKWNIHTMQMWYATESVQNSCNEKFIHDFSVIDKKVYRLEITRCSFELGHKWTPSMEILPVICRYSKFHLLTLRLTLDQLKKLIMMGFERTNGTTEWECSIDAMPQEEDFSGFPGLSITRPYQRLVVFKFVVGERLCAIRIRGGSLELNLKYKSVHDVEYTGPPRPYRGSDSDESDDSNHGDAPEDDNVSDSEDEDDEFYDDEIEYDDSFEDVDGEVFVPEN